MSKIRNNITPFSENIIFSDQWLDDFLLKQKGTEKVFNKTWQAYKYMLKDKMYCYIGIDDKENRPILTIKLDTMFIDMLRSSYEDIVDGYYMNKLYWCTVYLDGKIPKYVLTDMVATSYKQVLLTLSKKTQLEFL